MSLTLSEFPDEPPELLTLALLLAANSFSSTRLPADFSGLFVVLAILQIAPEKSSSVVYFLKSAARVAKCTSTDTYTRLEMSMDASSPGTNAPNTQTLTLGDTPTQAYLRPCSANTLNPAWQTRTELSEHFVSRRHWSRMRADIAQGRAFHPSVRSGRIHESDEDSRKPNPRLQGHRPVNLPSINETRSSVHQTRTFSTYPYKFRSESAPRACFCCDFASNAS